MTVLATSDIIALADNASKEAIAGMDIFVCLRNTAAQTYPSVLRLNHKLETVWAKYYCRRAAVGSAHWGAQCVLTPDGLTLYVVGESNNHDYNFLKLDALTGEYIWRREISLTGYRLIILDDDENIIIWGADIANANGVLKKYDSDGNSLWSTAIDDVHGIACDSDGNVYLAVETVAGDGLVKYNSGGAYVGGTAGSGPWCYDVKLDSAGDLIVTSIAHNIGGTDYQLYKYDTGLNRLAFVETNGEVWAQRLKIDSAGDIYVTSVGAGGASIEKFNPALVQQWNKNGPYMATRHTIATDVHDRIHFLKDYHAVEKGYEILANATGATLKLSNRFTSGSFMMNMVCSPRVYALKYTDQSTNHMREGTCCFQDDALPDFDHGGINTGVRAPWPGVPYGVPTDLRCQVESFTDPYWNIRRPDLVAGIFEVTEVPWSGNLLDLPGEERSYDQLSKTLVCANANWDTYAGFGGIGASPQIYTVTFVGMLKVSDSTPSPYNGEYLLVRGPGIWGFFFRCEHDYLVRINFMIQDQWFREDYIPLNPNVMLGDNKERLQFWIEDVGTVFNYQSVGDSVHDEKLTAIPNANLIGTPGAIAFGGTASMYPGQIEQWDAVTVWAVDRIVAWQGRFYIALFENSGSEPPSADWAVL